MNFNPVDLLNTSYGYSGQLSPEAAIEEQALNRRRMITNALMQQGMQPAQGQMVGRFYVPASPIQHAATMFNGAMGGLGEWYLGKKQKEIAETDREKYEDAIKAYKEKTGPHAVETPVQLEGPGAPEMTAQGQAASAPTPMSGPNTGDPQARMAMIQRKAPYFKEGPAPMGAVTTMEPASPETQRGALIDLLAHRHPQVQRMGQMLMAMQERQDDKADQRVFLHEQQKERLASDLLKSREHVNTLVALKVITEQQAKEYRDAIDKRHAELQKDLKTSDNQTRIDVAKIMADSRRDAAGAKASGEKRLTDSAMKKFLENSANLRSAENALELSSGRSVGDVRGSQDATGMKGYLPDPLLQRLDPKGVNTRAAVANIGSMVIHDRSGAAVTAAEFPRLKPFIPSATDNPETVQKKLRQFVNEYRAIMREMSDSYREAGYHVPETFAGQSAEPGGQPTTQAIRKYNPQTGKIE